jgi:hypothetical protein
LPPGLELVASPSSRRTSPIVTAGSPREFDTADLTEAKALLDVLP